MEQSLLLGQSEEILGWLTPVWIISVGIAFGLLLVFACKGLLFLLSRIPGLNSLHDSPDKRIISGIAVALGGLVLFFVYAYFSGMLGKLEEASDITLLAIFSILVSTLGGFGFIAVVSRARFEELQNLPRGNFASWLTKIAIGASVFAVAGFVLSFAEGSGVPLIVEKPMEKMNSLLRLPQTGLTQRELKIPSKSTTELETDFYGQELRYMQFKSDQVVVFGTAEVESLPSRSRFEVVGDGEFKSYRRQPGDSRIPDGRITKLYFQNRGDFDASLSVNWITDVEYPQVAIIPRIACSLAGIYIAFWMFCAACPKISAIGVATFKTEISQPVFILLALIGCVFAVGSIYIPYYTLGEDIKMYKMSALTLIRIMGIFMAIWAASKSVAEEIEGRTALTVLSKPVGRRQFILGKFSGISMAIGLMFVIVGLWFIVWVCYKPIYDTRETSLRDFGWADGFDEAAKMIPGLLLAYFESLVFVAISIAISTRLGILANFMLCFAIYVLGHLTPMIVQSAEIAQAFETVMVFGQFISVVFPVLDHFDVEPAIIGDVDVPLSYLGWASVYSLIYGSIAMLLSLVLFEDRDLA